MCKGCGDRGSYLHLMSCTQLKQMPGTDDLISQLNRMDYGPMMALKDRKVIMDHPSIVATLIMASNHINLIIP